MQMIEALKKYKKSNLQICHFLSQVDHESQHFTRVEENLNYSAERLLKVFPRYFTQTLAKSVERNPEKIANIIYGCRMGNSETEGYKYRGRGYLMITGKWNYQKFSEFIGVDCVANPELLTTTYALDSAVWFFTANRIWDICEKGATPQVVAEITKKVNGGYIGLRERQELFKKYYNEYKLC